MTIAAGFAFNGGLILCADTLETVPGISKQWVPKLILNPVSLEGRDTPDNLMIAMAGAGDGAFIDKIVERGWNDTQNAQSFSDACVLLERSIKRTYKHYGQIFQIGMMPTAELVYGIKMQGQSKLFAARGPVVNEATFGRSSVGAGYYMANFLASKMHQAALPGAQVLLLAAYVIFQCKEYVDGCGGDTQIAVLSNAGQSKRYDPWRTDFATKQLRDVDQTISTLLLSAADFTMESTNFKNDLDWVIERITAIRKEGEQFHNAWQRYVNETIRTHIRST